MENEFYKSRLESLRNEKSSISMVSNAKDRLVVSGLTFENYDSDSAYDSEEMSVTRNQYPWLMARSIMTRWIMTKAS
jgi:hypothetical protein